MVASAPNRISELDRWFSGKALTADWASSHFEKWQSALSTLRELPLEILEIGSWKGRSAIFWLNYFPHSHLTCIDTFAGSREQFDIGHSADGVEKRFDANLASFGNRVEKIRARSATGLANLAERQRRFDLIYIDGSHRRDDVLVDSLLAWPLLMHSGHIIWDDYTWGVGDRGVSERPQQAIDVFCYLHSGEIKIVSAGNQIIGRREAADRPQLGIRFSRTPRNLWRFLSCKPLMKPTAFS